MKRMIRKKTKTLYSLLKSLSLSSLILAFLLTIPGCSTKSNGMQKYSYDCWGTFDTIITIMGYSSSQDEFDRWTKQGEQKFLELNQLYDMYNDYPGINNIKTINDRAGISAVKVAPDLYNLIQSILDWQTKSPVAVNIALGSVLAVWHNYRAEGLLNPDQVQLPTMEELNLSAKHIDSSQIILDKENQTVFLADPDMLLDVGAVAKGFATEIVAQELKNAGWQSFIISSGGNVRAINQPADGVRSKWSIGIENPDYEQGGNVADIIETIYLADQSVVTSGDYQRFYTVDGKRYHHIIDPATLMPATYFSSVSVVTPDSGFADFLSTTFFILPYEQGLAYAKTLNHVEVMWIFTDGSIKTTDGMKQYLKSAGASWTETTSAGS